MTEGETTARVEVWCASLDRWVEGFDLVSNDDDGCIVRRISDGEVLPVAFSTSHVRVPVAASPLFPAGRPRRQR